MALLAVLIVPLWNWNKLKGKIAGQRKACSNRTFMELKSKYFSASIANNLSSNRTFMELKWEIKLKSFSDILSSNRTFMELKYVSSFVSNMWVKLF